MFTICLQFVYNLSIRWSHLSLIIQLKIKERGT
nr:MAG TPA: hypothetical protein [Caudoviricetes sp.]